MLSYAQQSTTFSVVTDYFTWRLASKTSTNNPLFHTVRQIAQRAEEKFPLQQSKFRCHSLSLSNIRSIHNEIGKELFSDGKVTWNRIIIFISFSALLTDCVIRQHNKDCVISSMINWTTDFIEGNLRSWLEKEHHWDGFLKVYCNSSQSEHFVVRCVNMIRSAVLVACNAMYITRM